MIINGNSCVVLKNIESNSITTIITDPPYGLGMAAWDFILPFIDVWNECYRVLKPGGLLLSFSSRRLQHKIACNLESCGFSIKDTIIWAYGTGMNRSTDISKNIDRINGVTLEERKKVATYIKECRLKKGFKKKEMYRNFGLTYMKFETSCNQALIPSIEKYHKIKKFLNMDDRFDSILLRGEAKRETIGAEKYKGANIRGGKNEIIITEPKTKEAKKWDGWKSGLKPAFEPIIVAQKPISEPSITENVLKHSAGAFNIKACLNEGKQAGNIIQDGSDCLEKVLNNNIFYCAKPSSKERSGNSHPTIKPIALMKYLIKLTVPKDGHLLDPYLGSGTTAVAAAELGVKFTGIELNKEYYEIAKKRLNN